MSGPDASSGLFAVACGLRSSHTGPHGCCSSRQLRLYKTAVLRGSDLDPTCVLVLFHPTIDGLLDCWIDAKGRGGLQTPHWPVDRTQQSLAPNLSKLPLHLPLPYSNAVASCLLAARRPRTPGRRPSVDYDLLRCCQIPDMPAASPSEDCLVPLCLVVFIHEMENTPGQRLFRPGSQDPGTEKSRGLQTP